jgi:hypothetical protein
LLNLTFFCAVTYGLSWGNAAVNGSNSRGKFVKGGLRLFLGMVQMVCAMAALLLLFTVGMQPMTQGSAGIALVAMGISRWPTRTRVGSRVFWG